jgi:NAD(P)-dependent dehydrogenase (short-subunit alcohol dehydrogenase family)
VVEEEGISEAEAEKRLVAKGRQVRMGEPEDIGAMIAFILSRHGSYLQGALIDVDGGRNKGL